MGPGRSWTAWSRACAQTGLKYGCEPFSGQIRITVPTGLGYHRANKPLHWYRLPAANFTSYGR
jgi:hypothetical protein